MSDTIKLVIEIPEEQKRMVDMMLDIPPQVENDLISAIRHGTPLSEVLAEIKGEISRGHIEADLMYVGRILEIIDNHISREGDK